MTRFIAVVSMFALGVLTLGGALSPVAAADVRIGVNIGVPGVVVAPPPPVIVAPPPPMVIAPGAPVYYYGTRYYTYYNGGWFLGPAYAGPWTYVPVARVPRPIIAVPHAYYRMPPGHAKHFAGPPPWAHGHRHWKHDNGHGKHKHKHKHRDRD
jgi:hypothetical protein